MDFNPTDVPSALHLEKIRQEARKHGLLYVVFRYFQPKERDEFIKGIAEANPTEDERAAKEKGREDGTPEAI